MNKITICLFLFSFAIAIKVNKYIPLRMLAYNPQTIFLSKFDFGNNDGEITVRFRYTFNKSVNLALKTFKFPLSSSEF
jgi:hypothetical protein